MLKISNENTRKKCEICPDGSYSEKKSRGEFHGRNILDGGSYFPEWN